MLVPAGMLPLEFDLARPELGGHLIRASRSSRPLIGEAGAWPGNPVILDGTADQEAFFVMGFQDGRAAAIREISVTNDPLSSDSARLAALRVSASMQGPMGPWTEVGRIDIDPSSDEGLLRFEAPFWARTLLFTLESPGDDGAPMPSLVSVIEDRAAEGGGSILGEWGARARDAIWERMHGEDAGVPGLAGGESAATAVDLPAGALAEGRVTAAAPHRFYRLTPPSGAQSLTILPGTGDVMLALSDAAGTSVPLEPASAGWRADVAGRAGPFLLDIGKVQDSVVVAWDTSGSVASFAPAIFAAVQDLAASLKHGDLAMNFVPFRALNRGGDGAPLLGRFASDAGTAWAALNAYADTDFDSDAEAALIVASRALAAEPGRHAIVLITDASFSNQLTEEAWTAIQAANPRIHALRVPTGTGDAAARAQAALMQDWAGFNHGEHRIFADASDARAAFRNLAAALRRPVVFRLTWDFSTAPLPPATLTVQAAPMDTEAAPIASGRAMEVILDASGSMLQKVDGTRKIDLAKAILSDLIRSDLPAGTDFALRDFGTGGEGSCDGSAVLPLGPLDPAVAASRIARIKAVNGARTAIGDSLKEAGRDLAAVADGRLIVLITDGEETCGGDPAAEIAALKAQGFDLKLNIVGFDLEDPGLKDQFRSWAEAGGGGFFDATDAAALRGAVREAVAQDFRLLAADGREIAKGRVGGPPVSLPPGDYSLVVGSGSPAQPIHLDPGEAATVNWP